VCTFKIKSKTEESTTQPVTHFAAPITPLGYFDIYGYFYKSCTPATTQRGNDEHSTVPKAGPRNWWRFAKLGKAASVAGLVGQNHC
jgi:hypothetical protein